MVVILISKNNYGREGASNKSIVLAIEINVKFELKLATTITKGYISYHRESLDLRAPF